MCGESGYQVSQGNVPTNYSAQSAYSPSRADYSTGCILYNSCQRGC
jgi:hypothetical protein